MLKPGRPLVWLGCLGLGLCLAGWMDYSFGYAQQAPSSSRPAIRGSSFVDAVPRKDAQSTGVVLRPDQAPDPSDLNTTKPDHVFISFRTLSGFSYPEPPPGAGGLINSLPPPPGISDPLIPEGVRRLHGRDVLTMGFMLPLNLDSRGRVTSFLLLRDQSLCCFGQMPRVNDYIAVQMKEGKTAPSAADEPILVSGRLEVGAMVEQGLILGIYKMEATLVETAADIQRRR